MINTRFMIFIGLCGLLVALPVAFLQHSAGYMDAEYYYTNGKNIATGKGLTEEIIWNYLDDPNGLPKPSHAYWMPLVSFITSFGLFLFPSAGFLAARLPFLLIVAIIPPITILLAMKITNNQRKAQLAGCLSIFPAFYLPFLTVPDCFGLLMILGGIYFLLLFPKQTNQPLTYIYTGRTVFGLGIISGLMHLARADGLLWLGVTFLVVFRSWWENQPHKRITQLILPLLISISGYLVVMLPWFVRNQIVFGAPLAPGNIRALFISEYNELYIIPASQLTFEHLIQSGTESILRARLWSAGQNLQTAVAIQGVIFLTPLIVLGLWRVRNLFPVQIALVAWCLLFFSLSLIFPFQSARGGFFHSGAAFQPLFWSVAPLGLDSFVEWGNRKRRWDIEKARKIFGFGLVGLSLFLTILVSYKHIIGTNNTFSGWDATEIKYLQVENYLVKNGYDHKSAVMVNDPPGYYAVAGRSAISIPFSDLDQVCQAARRYQARFLLLEIDQIPAEPDLFLHPDDRMCLRYLGTVADIRIFQIEGF